MKRLPTMFIILLVVAVGLACSHSARASASVRAHSSVAKRVCQAATRKAHGKKKRAKVCRAVKAPTPTPVPAPTATPDTRPFSDIWDVAVDRAGNVYVDDGGHSRIDELSPDGKVIAHIGENVHVPNNFNLGALAVDGQGNVYLSIVGDGPLPSDQAPIVEFSPSGTMVHSLGTGNLGTPFAMTFDAAGNLYVSDFPTSVKRFTADGSFQGTLTDQLQGAWGIRVDSGGNILAVEHRSGDVVKLSPSGKVLARWDNAEHGFLGQPTSLALDSHDNLYVNDRDGNRVVKLSDSGKYLGAVNPNGTTSVLDGPQGLAVDAQDNLYVADSGNNRIDKFSPSGQLVATLTGN